MTDEERPEDETPEGNTADAVATQTAPEEDAPDETPASEPDAIEPEGEAPEGEEPEAQGEATVEATQDAESPAPGDGEEPLEVRRAELPELKAVREAQTSDGAFGKIDMVLDVSVPITVELGRTRLFVRDVLRLGVGAVVELDKVAGEAVDLFVRDLKFATGEVVVVDDRFAVRIKEIVDPRAEARDDE